MHYLSVENLAKTFADKALFTNATFHISRGDKVALVAKNGTGKTTLLRIISGLETSDSGKLWVHKDVKICYLDQNPQFDPNKTVIESIFDHENPVIEVIKKYEKIIEDPNPDERELQTIMNDMDQLNAWLFESKMKQIINALRIKDLYQKTATLSGGQKKRVSLAKTLLDIEFDEGHKMLILDEPTNHLDFDMIDWLENYLLSEQITLLMVTHDRYFLDNVCNQIIELTESDTHTYKGDYEYFLETKAEREQASEASIDKARNLLRKELEWMRKQPKARTTKSKSRIDAFYELETKASQKKSDAALQLGMKMSRLGGKVLEMKKVYKNYGERKILKGFDYTFKRGDRIGIIGPNGVGKTTFLNILLGKEQPDSGKINHGETVVFGYFDQTGIVIKEDKRVIEYVRDFAEHFTLADGTKVSAAQFLQLFLFTPEQQFTHISKLSGGEKKRLQLLTVLFRSPNFLILDEPTNDLDLITLQTLEQFLENYPGCLVVVSHDRYFMDRLVDHLFVFEGDGVISDFPGNYTLYRFYQQQQSNSKNQTEAIQSTALTSIEPALSEPQKTKRKLSYKEQRELEQIEGDIPKLEKERDEINAKLASGTGSFEEINKLTHRIGEIAVMLEKHEMRWLELSEG
jgi:ATP-binding cassette subfamily F protein uup